MSGPADWIVWQLADSAFPTGGFAHAGGMEAAYQHGEIRGREDLVEFLEAALGQAGRSALPFVTAAYDAGETFGAIDEMCEAFTSNHVANRASRLQGQALLKSAERAFGKSEFTALRQRARELPLHFAPVFGWVARGLGLEREQAVRLFLFNQLRGWMSSAVRLGIVGPLEAQAIQARVARAAEETVQRSMTGTLDEIAQTAPLLDIFQGTQDRLYSRLFQS